MRNILQILDSTDCKVLHDWLLENEREIKEARNEFLNNIPIENREKNFSGFLKNLQIPDCICEVHKSNLYGVYQMELREGIGKPLLDSLYLPKCIPIGDCS